MIALAVLRDEGPTTVGPMGLTEHLLWFLFLSLIVFLIYHGLRVESVKEAAARGFRRWLTFLFGTAVLALVSGILAAIL